MSKNTPNVKDMFENRNAVSLIAINTVRLLTNPIMAATIERDPSAFAMAYAALYQFAPNIRPQREQERDKETRKELREILTDLDRRFGAEVTSHYGSVFFAGCLFYEELYDSGDFSKWSKFLETAGKAAAAIQSHTTVSAETSALALRKLLDLNDAETKLVTFQIMRHDFAFSQFYNRIFTARSPEMTKFFLGNILDEEDSLISTMLEKDAILIKSSLINYNPISGRLGVFTDSMVTWLLSTPLTSDFLLKSVKPLVNKTSSSGSISTFQPLDKTLIIELLKTAAEEKAVNILAYGGNRLDKKAAVFNMLKDQDFEVHTLNGTHLSGSDQAARTYIAQRVLSKLKADKQQILVIEDADSVLSRRGGGGMSSFFGLAIDDDTEEHLETDEILLEENPCSTIWIVDRPKSLLEENVGRFLFHCEIKQGSRADRRDEIEKIVKDLGLSEALRLHLSKYQMLSKNQVQSAVRLASYVADPLIPEDTENVLKRGIQQSQKALQRDFMEELRESVTTYSLDYINTTSAFTPNQVLEALKKRPKGTICLYGIPGSGKTQFAEYLALQLDKPIIMKRASDLLDKYVGENEKNIAGMFREAAEDDAILFLDEADSFLRDRSMARAEWSVTQVNELLQQMERFPGIFIVATNLFKSIDAAALRRFTFKFEFLAMTDVQRWKMFQTETGLDKYIETELAKEDGAVHDAEQYMHDVKTSLLQIRNLTPGDFATVKRQADILGSQLDPFQWIEQLSLEAKAKLEGLERNGMGFTAAQ